MTAAFTYIAIFLCLCDYVILLFIKKIKTNVSSEKKDKDLFEN